MGQEHEVHGGGGRQVGGPTDEHPGTEHGEGESQPGDVGTDLPSNALNFNRIVIKVSHTKTEFEIS